MGKDVIFLPTDHVIMDNKTGSVGGPDVISVLFGFTENEDRKTFPCDQCDYKATLQSSLSLHKKTKKFIKKERQKKFFLSLL